jgi:hypothetical protein
MTGPIEEAVQRVHTYLVARRQAQGLDPEVIHGYNDLELRASDIRLLLATARSVVAAAVLGGPE